MATTSKKFFYLRSVETDEGPFGEEYAYPAVEQSRHCTRDKARAALRRRVAYLRLNGYSRTGGRGNAAIMETTFDHGSQASQNWQTVKVRLYIT